MYYEKLLQLVQEDAMEKQAAALRRLVNTGRRVFGKNRPHEFGPGFADSVRAAAARQKAIDPAHIEQINKDPLLSAIYNNAGAAKNDKYFVADLLNYGERRNNSMALLDDFDMLQGKYVDRLTDKINKGNIYSKQWRLDNQPFVTTAPKSVYDAALNRAGINDAEIRKMYDGLVDSIYNVKVDKATGSRILPADVTQYLLPSRAMRAVLKSGDYRLSQNIPGVWNSVNIPPSGVSVMGSTGPLRELLFKKQIAELKAILSRAHVDHKIIPTDMFSAKLPKQLNTTGGVTNSMGSFGIPYSTPEWRFSRLESDGFRQLARRFNLPYSRFL